MILKQYYLGCLAHASYLLGDEASSTAIVVDPQRDIAQYVADAERLGLQIRHVFLTHFHADFIAGHLELRDRCGPTIYLGSRAEAEYAFVKMADGDTLEFPGMRLQVWETPGHTIESISILVFDLAEDAARPYAVLTGDTLFIGDVGRPDFASLAGVDGKPILALICTTRCTTSCCGCRMRRWCIRRMGQGRFAGRIFRRIRFLRWESSDGSTTRCSR